MRYGDVVHFDPIESIVQLRLAGQEDEALKLIKNYVISDEMAEKINAVIFNHLQFDEPADNKAQLIVGNYGTGKSHLMSVISLLAEDAKYVQYIRHPKVAENAAQIAGKFKVHRIEISSQMGLRDIITHELETFLAGHDITFKFPPADQITNSKDCLLYTSSSWVGGNSLRKLLAPVLHSPNSIAACSSSRVSLAICASI